MEEERTERPAGDATAATAAGEPAAPAAPSEQSLIPAGGALSEGTGVSGAPAEAPGLGGPGEVELLAAALRADVADLATFERVLVTSLAAAFPEGMVEVDRERSLSDRMAGRDGKVRALRLHLGETTLELVAGRGTPVGYVARGVRGVTISRKEVPLSEWVGQLAEALQRHAAKSAEASEALGRLLGA